MSPTAHKLQHQALWISGFEKRKRHVQDNVAATKVHTRQQILWQADSENPLSRAHSKSIAALTRANECIRMASSGSQRGGSVGGDSIGNTGREGTKGSGSAQRLRALLPSTPGGPYKRPPSPTGPGGPRKQKRTAVPAACESASVCFRFSFCSRGISRLCYVRRNGKTANYVYFQSESCGLRCDEPSPVSFRALFSSPRIYGCVG